jgi:excisionase family DNA binding protein
MKIWMNVAEGAEYAGVSRDTIYTACERTELRHARIGGRRSMRLKTGWIDAWLERHVRGTRDGRATGADAYRRGVMATSSGHAHAACPLGSELGQSEANSCVTHGELGWRISSRLQTWFVRYDLLPRPACGERLADPCAKAYGANAS